MLIYRYLIGLKGVEYLFMKIQYKNNIEELEKLLYHYYNNYTKVFENCRYLIAIVSMSFAIGALVRKEPIATFIMCVVLTPLSYLFIKKMEPTTKRNTCKKALKQMRKEGEYFLGKKTLEIKDSCIFINYSDNCLKFKLHNRVIVDVVDNYVIIIDLNKASNKYKLIIPNNEFENENEKETFIDIIKSKIIAKK